MANEHIDNEHSRGSVLLVDQQVDVRKFLGELISSKCGCRTDSAGTASGAVMKLGHEAFDLVVTDLSLPDTDGEWLLEQIHRQAPQTNVIAISEDNSAAKVLEAMRAGARDFLVKPLDTDDLLDRIGHLLAQRRLDRANQKWRRRTAEHMRRLRNRRRRLAEQVELVCRDLVGGYRRTVEKLLELQMQEECREAIEGELQMKPLLSSVLRYLSKTFDEASGAVFLWPLGWARARLFTPSGGGPPGEVDDYDRALVKGIIDLAISRRKPLLGSYSYAFDSVEDSSSDSVQASPSAAVEDDGAVNHRPRSLLGTGLYVGQDIVGAVVLQRKRENPFTPEECKLLGSLAEPIAKAVHMANCLDGQTSEPNKPGPSSEIP